MKNEKCGIYKIECRANGRIYIGSSKQVYVRWSQHRTALRKGKSHCRHLQHAWTKYGADAFAFSVIEECPHTELEVREQYYIDALRPALNTTTEVKRRFTAEMHAKIASKTRARSDALTHCPHGHFYDNENTYKSKRSRHICRICNALRVAKIYANETPEQRIKRLAKGTEYHLANYDERMARQREYAVAHKAEKSAYDKERRAEANMQRRARRAALTPKQLEVVRAKKRAAYRRSRLNG